MDTFSNTDSDVFNERRTEISAKDNNPTDGNDSLHRPTVQQLRLSERIWNPLLRLGWEHALTQEEDADVSEVFSVHEPSSYREGVENISK